MKTTMWMRFSFLRFATVFVFLQSGLLGKGNDFTVGERKDAAAPDSNTNCVLSLFSGRRLFDKERVLLPSKNGTARYWIEDEEETAGSHWHLVHLKCNDNGCLFRCEENERLWLLSVQTAIVMEDVDTTRNFTSRYVFLTQPGSQDSHITPSEDIREDGSSNDSGSSSQDDWFIDWYHDVESILNPKPESKVDEIWTGTRNPTKETSRKDNPSNDSGCHFLDGRTDVETIPNQGLKQDVPDLQSANSLAEAIRNLPFGDEQTRLAEFARTHRFGIVRMAAVKKLLDKDVLAEIAEKEEMPPIRAEAVRKLSDRKILKKFLNDESILVRRAAETAFRASSPGQEYDSDDSPGK